MLTPCHSRFYDQRADRHTLFESARAEGLSLSSQGIRICYMALPEPSAASDSAAI